MVGPQQTAPGSHLGCEADNAWERLLKICDAMALMRVKANIARSASDHMAGDRAEVWPNGAKVSRAEVWAEVARPMVVEV